MVLLLLTSHWALFLHTVSTRMPILVPNWPQKKCGHGQIVLHLIMFGCRLKEPNRSELVKHIDNFILSTRSSRVVIIGLPKHDGVGTGDQLSYQHGFDKKAKMLLYSPSLFCFPINMNNNYISIVIMTNGSPCRYYISKFIERPCFFCISTFSLHTLIDIQTTIT